MNSSAQKLIERIAQMDIGEVRLMEVCGTHTMSIAKSGIRTMLPENVKLVSGPGCPVCVTPKEVIDEILKLSQRDDIIIATYGDMLKVPGSMRGDSLARRKALGAQVEIVYSPIDAIRIAQEHQSKEVVFLGVGFETTAPGTAAAIKTAAEMQLSNFSVLSMLKMVEPAIRALYQDESFNVQGFLCPGHVAVIIGETGLRFITDELKIPAVIAGFEPEDILLSVYRLCKQIEEKKPHLENEYRRIVEPQGNILALQMMEEVLEPREDIWRGLNQIPASGLGIREAYAAYDAEKKFGITYAEVKKEEACRCGEVIKGQLSPVQCPLFGKVCTPSDPVGPCMVSSEGSCAAAYKYGDWEDSLWMK